MQLIITLLFSILIICVSSQPIKNDMDAFESLSKFGFDINQCDSSSASDCPSKIIREFQQAIGLPETGQFDKATMELLNRPRCGNFEAPTSDRFPLQGPMLRKWEQNKLKWALIRPSPNISYDKTIAIIEEAFLAWTKHIPMDVERVCKECQANIVFDFGDGYHGDDFPFLDGTTLAHAFPPNDGRIHFNNAVQWTDKFNGELYNLYFVAIHEIGHALGLSDKANIHSIMSFIYGSWQKDDMLPDMDRADITRIYGRRRVDKAMDPTDNMIGVLINKETNKVLHSIDQNNIFTHDRNDDDNRQKWIFKKQEDDSYILQNVATSFVLDFKGERAYLNNANGGDSQKWKFNKQYNDKYILENVATSRVLHFNNESLVYYPALDESDYQMWTIEITTISPQNKMIAFLRNKATDQVLSVNKNRLVSTVDKNKQNDQKWILVQQQDGSYIVKNLATSLVLQMNRGRLHTNKVSRCRSRKWRFVKQQNGSYILKNAQSSRMLDLSNQTTTNHTDHQEWFLELATIDPQDKMIVSLVNKATNKLIHSSREKSVYISRRNDSDYQKWTLNQQQDGTFIVRNLATSLKLDHDGSRTYTGDVNNGDYQKWKFIKEHDDSFVVENLATSHILAAEMPLHSNDNNHQKWNLELIYK